MTSVRAEGAVTRDDELVSVIVPCYNKGAFVRETLASVLAQTDVPLELIVVDDRSTDDSWTAISEFVDDPRVSAHRLPENRGSTFTRNHGAELARGGYLMFLDGDDVLRPGTLSALRDAIRGATDAVAVCSWRKLHREGDGWVPRASGKPLDPPGGNPVRAWLSGWYVPPCAVLWARPVFERTGGWGEMGPWDDADIMMRTLLHGTRIRAAAGGESYYRILDEGGSLRTLATEKATRSRIRVLDNVGATAEALGSLDQYRASLGEAYYRLARTFVAGHPTLVLECLRKADRHLGHKPLDGSPLHRVLWRVLGLERKERLARWLATRGLARRGLGDGAPAGAR